MKVLKKLLKAVDWLVEELSDGERDAKRFSSCCQNYLSWIGIRLGHMRQWIAPCDKCAVSCNDALERIMVSGVDRTAHVKDAHEAVIQFLRKTSPRQSLLHPLRASR